MSNLKKGCHRDNMIVQAVEKHGCLDAEQIEVLYFRGLSQGKRICQRRLEVLSKKKRLRRDRPSLNVPYYYYSTETKKPGQADHRVGLNWAYIWLLRELKSWEQMHSLEYEVDYKAFRMDALAGIKNKVTGKFKLYFIEMDRSDNAFQKVRQLNEFYQAGAYLSAWWVILADRFPATIVVTENERRYRHIEEKIKTENVCGLEFRLYMLAQIKDEAREA